MAGLQTYRAKRDFGVTAEPRGHVARGKARQLRFVIQRHAATRLHYDLRLELDGVYKSWAITKVPSLDPATKRLAVEVEDHPLEYGSFEGTIPKGQYGGGTVQLWDRGTWKSKSDDPQRDLANGMLKFEISGTRMHGGWALIRMRDEERRSPRQPRCRANPMPYRVRIHLLLPAVRLTRSHRAKSRASGIPIARANRLALTAKTHLRRRRAA
jgi:bifunctional non-homologous end joining protein LigD